MSDFEKRVEQYLMLSGWEYRSAYDGGVSEPTSLWKDSEGTLYLLYDAFIYQLKEDFEKSGDIERAAEILGKKR